MRKSIAICLICVSIFIISLGITMGVIFFTNSKEKNIEKEQVEIAKVNNNEIKEEIKQVASSEEKITPNTKLVLKKYYKSCGHTINSYVELPQDLINMTKEELQNEYKDWKIEKFSEQEAILLKDEEGFCNEHYILKEKDGFVAVYLIDRAGQEVLKEITNIWVDYLPQNDLLNIKNGIKIYGTEQLNKTLEDYE